MHVQAVLRREDALWVLASLCAIFRMRFDPTLLTDGYTSPDRLVSFHEAARVMGLTTFRCPLARVDWRKIALPLVGFEAQPLTPITTLASLRGRERRRKIRDQTPPHAPARPMAPPETLTALMITKTSSYCLEFLRYGGKEREQMPIADAGARLASELILVANEIDGVGTWRGAIPEFVCVHGAGRRFGLSVLAEQDRRRQGTDRRTARERRSRSRSLGAGGTPDRRVADAATRLALTVNSPRR